MIQNKAFKTDWGLSVRMFIVGLLLTIIAVAFGLVLFSIGLPLYFVVGIDLIFLFIQLYFSDKIALLSFGAKIVSPQEEPRLHALVERVVALADMPKPRVAVANLDLPNAFATGRSQKAAVVCATSGIMRRLDDQELEAVLAHEISHVAHRDVVVMTVASFLAMVAALMMRMALYMGFFGGFGYSQGNRNSDNNNNGGQNAFAVELVILVVSAIVYAISYLLILTLSRYRELAADRSGALLIGKPSLLKSALIKVTGAMGSIPTGDLRHASHFNGFFFAPALVKGSIVSTLFSTHPPLEKRIAELDKLERAMNS